MNEQVIGILAHVDAGKTTLSEAMLYASGTIRKMGRVDTKDAFLDTNTLERARGITIFSKQARLKNQDMSMILLDTPGHVDFSAEMERTLQVLDYAILVISGADGVQGHTRTLWKILKKYNIPVFLFINKMDQPGTLKDNLLKELKQNLDEGCIEFSKADSEAFYEAVAMSDEEILNHFLETGSVGLNQIRTLISQRKIFPCYFGSALKMEGVKEFLDGLHTFCREKIYPSEFGAKVFKITRDPQGTRLTHLKVTGGSLKVKSVLPHKNEKINQIRIYSGEKYETVNEVNAGSICAVTGPLETFAGEGLGIEKETEISLLEPVLNYQIQLPKDCNPAEMLPKLRMLEEEDPKLHVVWNEKLKEIQIQLMGEVQTEVLKQLILERFGMEVDFCDGNIVYKETIENVVEGVGHFEPLRHYAEVHLLLEPAPIGSGLHFDTDCSEDVLDKNWQRLILTHLQEKEQKGVLTGAAITDMKITLVAGRAHPKHTEGGDFRQATYRALRQGLREAESILLEPYYEYHLELPQEMVGRAMTDIEKMCGTCQLSEGKDQIVVLKGLAPVVTMANYQKEVQSYTKGRGHLTLELKGYFPCHNSEEVIEEATYNPEGDVENPTGSVFCQNGTSVIIPWNHVKDWMHVETVLETDSLTESKEELLDVHSNYKMEDWIDTEEIDEILDKTFYANKRDKSMPRKGVVVRRTKSVTAPDVRVYKRVNTLEEYLLVDGYNVIHAWKELEELAEKNIEGARGSLMDMMCNYQGIRGCKLIVVFDAYKIKGHETEICDYHNIHVVYTKEDETADQYIEKFAHENGRKYNVTVVTSDGLEQITIRGQGCNLISSREFEQEVKSASEAVKKTYEEKKVKEKTYLLEGKQEELRSSLLDMEKLK